MSLILLPGVVEDILEVKLGLQMTKHHRIIIILDPTFEIMKISLLLTELFNFPKRGADLAENRLESTLCRPHIGHWTQIWVNSEFGREIESYSTTKLADSSNLSPMWDLETNILFTVTNWLSDIQLLPSMLPLEQVKLHYYHPRPASTWIWDKYWQGRACTEWRPLCEKSRNSK